MRTPSFKRSLSKIKHRYKRGVKVGWLQTNLWVIVALLLICLLTIFIRTYFTVEPALRYGFQLSGGSDSYYHKYCIEHVIKTRTQLVEDPLLNYPSGAANPRPPFFDWSIAIVGIVLAPFFDGDIDTAVSWSIVLAAMIWAVATVIPIYFLATELFGRRAGVIAALLMSITAGHIERGHFGFADHDSAALFFIITAFYFLIKMDKHLKDHRRVSNWRNLQSIVVGFGEFYRDSKIALGYAVMTGLSFAAAALIWKGFVYAIAILFIYALAQLVVYRVRNIDTFEVYYGLMTVFIVMLLIMFPTYIANRVMFGTWITTLYLFTGVMIFGIGLVITRDQPWLLVLPLILLIIGGALAVLYVISPQTLEILYTGMGYFVKTKLYGTIAEAQAPSISRIITSFGIVTFFLGLVAIWFSIREFRRTWSKPVFLMIVWSICALYMAFSAVRFLFNATPVFAILAGWITAIVIDKVHYGEIVKTFRAFSGSKLHALRRGIKPRHIIGTIFIVLGILLPNTWFAVDAGIPYELKRKYDPDGKYLGAFGMSFPSDYWRAGYQWLAEQDTHLPPEERPAFISWWDYGFECIANAKRPTVADNFQFGHQLAGNFITAQNESSALAYLIIRLLEHRWLEPQIVKILSKYLTDTQIAKLQDAYREPAKYVKLVENNPELYDKRIDVLPPNARYIYQNAILCTLPEPQLADLLHEVEVATGKSIRYFAVDYRLFPFSAANTGIFYAPVTLSDRDIDEFLGYTAITTAGEMPLEEAQKRAREDPNFRIRRYELEYLEPFFRSMFYRAYIGYSGLDLGLGRDAGIPALTGELQNYIPMQGWNLTHFKLVYRTMYWSPKSRENATFPDDYKAMNDKEAEELYREKGGHLISGLRMGVIILKYYDGAYVRGYVRTTEGVPVKGCRVTVQDDYGIPHDYVFTDDSGYYNLTVPFGEIKLSVSKGGWGTGEYVTYQKLTGVETRVLNTTTLTISDEQAMRRVPDWIIWHNITVELAKLEGKVYWDVNEDNSYKPEDDELVSNAVVILNETDSSRSRELYTATINETGTYVIDNILPGKYKVELQIYNQTIKLDKELEFNPNDKKTEDLGIKPCKINGTVWIETTEQTVANLTLKLKYERGDTLTAVTDTDGYFEFNRLIQGKCKLTIHSFGLSTYRKSIELKESTKETLNISLTRILPIEGKVVLEDDTTTPAGGAQLLFINTENQTRIRLRTDTDGKYSGNITYANYTVYCIYINNNLKYVNLSSLQYKLLLLSSLPNQQEEELAEKTEEKYIPPASIKPFVYNISLVPGIKFNGSVKLQPPTTTATTTSVIPQNLKLELELLQPQPGTNDTHNINTITTRYILPVNASGYYQTYLPAGEYQIKVSKFNPKLEPTNRSTIYVYGTKVKLHRYLSVFTHDIELVRGLKFYGWTYWDRNEDKKYTEVVTTTTTTTNESSADKNESEDITLANIELQLKNSVTDTVWQISSNSAGYFECWLPPGEYQLQVISRKGIKPTNYSITLPSTLDEFPHNVSVTLDKIKICGYLRFLDNRLNPLPVINFNFSIEGRTVGALDTTIATTNASGWFKVELLPGNYSIYINESRYENGTECKYEGNFSFEVSLEDELLNPELYYKTVDFILTKKIKVNGSIAYNLTEENTKLPTTQNVIIEFYSVFNSTLENYTTALELTLTTKNATGYYSGYITPGYYQVKAYYYDRSINVTNITYIDIKYIELKAGNTLHNFELKAGINVTGYALLKNEQNETIDNVTIYFVVANQTIVQFTSTNTTGGYELILLPDTCYRVVVNFSTTLSIPDNDDDVNVRYVYDGVLTLTNLSNVAVIPTTVIYNLTLTRLIRVTGIVFHDIDDNDEPDEQEIQPAVIVRFETGRNQSVFTTSTNATGSYELYLPENNYTISVILYGFISDPNPSTFNVSLKNTTCDLKLTPSNISISGWIFFDINRNLRFDSSTDQLLTTNIVLKFIAMTPAGMNHTLELTDFVDEDAFGSQYNTTLLPGEYTVYAYNRLNQNIYVFLNTLKIEVASEPQTYNISLVPGFMLRGTVYYYDTDGVLMDEFDTIIRLKALDFNNATLELLVDSGYYSEYIPYGNYTLFCEYEAEEYNMTMIYKYEREFTFTLNDTYRQLLLELTKELKYEVELEVVGDNRVTVDPGTTVEFRIKIINKGNTEDEFSIETMGVPSGWTVKLSEDKVKLWVTESTEIKVEVQLGTAEKCYARNTLTIRAKSKGDTAKSDSVNLFVNTPEIYGFEIYCYTDTDRGVTFESTVKYQIAVKNTGNTQDTIEITPSESIPANWTLKISEQEVTEEKPYKHTFRQDEVYKNFTVELTAPNSTQAQIGERIEITLLSKSTRADISGKPIVLTATISRPDLIIDSIKVENRRLKEGTNITIYVGIRSKFVEIEDTEVRLFVNNEEINTTKTGKIEEDGVVYVNFSFDGSRYKGKTIDIRVEVDPENEIDEEDNWNNWLDITVRVGPPKKPPEFNWRPWAFFGAIIAIIVALIVIWKWRQRV